MAVLREFEVLLVDDADAGDDYVQGLVFGWRFRGFVG